MRQMKRFNFLLFFFGLILTPSCTYEASFFNRLELEREEELIVCEDGQVVCGTACVWLHSDAHCGVCYHACERGRSCKSRTLENGEEAYFCACPSPTVDCGSELSCMSLDGDKSGPNDGRCGDCNVVCAPSEQCLSLGFDETERNVCVCEADGSILSDEGGEPLYGLALSEAYLRSDAHCGGCGVNCDVKSGEHCVLGQCTKTVCDDKECHFTLPDGREACQPCQKRCWFLGNTSPEEGGFLVPVTGYRPAEKALLTVQNTHSKAYRLEGNAFEFKRVIDCGCGEKGEAICDLKADRCDAEGRCVCGSDDRICDDDVVCTSEGCRLPCDALGRACSPKADCVGSEGDVVGKQCRCRELVLEDSHGLAHCVDGLVCGLDGKCYCPTGGDECGLHGDRCADEHCVCGDTGGPCLDEAVCQLGECKCGDGDACDPMGLNPNCFDGICQCGDETLRRPCNDDERCFEGRCVCVEASACKGDKADLCVESVCVCGDTGGPCLGDRICVDGRCLCTEDSDCPDYESCDAASGQCHCGGAKPCRGGSFCTEAGYCRCDSDGACHDAETCKDVGAFGQVCVCSGTYKQKACRLGARCKLSWGSNKCTTDNVRACYEGERVKSKGFCVCGKGWYSCRPGESCVGGKCE